MRVCTWPPTTVLHASAPGAGWLPKHRAPRRRTGKTHRGAFEHALAAGAVLDRRAEQDQRGDQRVAPERWPEARAACAEQRRSGPQGGGHQPQHQHPQAGPERQAEPDAERDQRPHQRRADEFAPGMAGVGLTGLLAQRHGLHDRRQVERRIGQRKHEHRHHDQRAAPGNPACTIAVGRCRRFRAGRRRRIREDGVRRGTDHRADEHTDRKRQGEHADQRLFLHASHRDQRERQHQHHVQRVGAQLPEVEQREQHYRGQQHTGGGVVLEQRHHQHAGGDQRSEHARDHRRLDHRQRWARLAQHQQRHDADDIGRLQRQAVGDEHGQPQADRQPQCRLVAARHVAAQYR